MTAAAVFVDASSGEMRWAVAGHPDPVVEPIDAGRDLRGGPPLGVLREAEHPEQRRRWTRGSRVLLYTDGLLEPFLLAGEERPQRALADRLLATADFERLQSARTEDDATLMVIDASPHVLRSRAVRPGA